MIINKTFIIVVLMYLFDIYMFDWSKNKLNSKKKLQINK